MIEYLQVAVLWLSRRLWLSLPFLMTAAAMVVTLAPMNLLGGKVPAPDIALAAVFFWAIYGPGFLPPWAVFLLGLGQDFTSGTPIGFWALIYLLAYGFTLSQRVFFIGRTLRGVWLGFAVVAFLTAAVTWFAGSIAYARWLPAGDIYLQALISVAVFPLVSKVFTLMRRMLTTAREAI
ncbi:MAG: hypothetical protein KBA31_12990 [Alphaproteobacteria bacterium]|nr:hypothetical protein [Alphaproteobacteria bacterium]